MTTTVWITVAGLAVGTAAIKAFGPVMFGGRDLHPLLGRIIPLLAPAWVAERSVCGWLALACRLRGGITYAGHRLPRAATPAAVLRRRSRPLRAAGSPEPGPHVRPVAERLDRRPPAPA